VSSELGKGSAFDVFVPAYQRPTET
jgi:hypothetical protein